MQSVKLLSSSRRGRTNLFFSVLGAVSSYLLSYSTNHRCEFVAPISQNPNPTSSVVSSVVFCKSLIFFQRKMNLRVKRLGSDHSNASATSAFFHNSFQLPPQQLDFVLTMSGVSVLSSGFRTIALKRFCLFQTELVSLSVVPLDRVRL
ncbi:hypothetical protein NE237_024391 [Protea cynaroides]|uniref:Uncharacterized protein n=1 Tax=Protea cynaroides TaxID=273540 RepID=A0A9Q0HHX6_9MAGN|nr:hypothetical protein NE237_024391 [Protea cynaroides]